MGGVIYKTAPHPQKTDFLKAVFHFSQNDYYKEKQKYMIVYEYMSGQTHVSQPYSLMQPT